MYHVLNSWKWVHLIKHPFVCFIKAIIPLFNYDGEPSVSNGILYQLPSSHLFIHWVPAKLSNRVMPYGVNYCRLQLLFVFWYYWPVHSTGYGYSVDASPASFSAGHCADAVVHATPSLSGFFPEPCPVSELSGTRQGSGIIILMCLCSKCFLLFLPFNVRKHLFRIIRSSLLHNRIDDSQKLAGNHDQRLHLFERILCSGRVVYVKFLKFISMCYRWLCRLEQPVSESFASSMANLGFSLVFSELHATTTGSMNAKTEAFPASIYFKPVVYNKKGIAVNNNRYEKNIVNISQ